MLTVSARFFQEAQLGQLSRFVSVQKYIPSIHFHYVQKQNNCWSHHVWTMLHQNIWKTIFLHPWGPLLGISPLRSKA